MARTPDGQELPRFEILGPVRAWRGEAELDLGPAKQRAVLTALLINANRPVPTAQIVDTVWQTEPPENGANVVQKYVAGLRRVLEPDRSPRSPGSLLALTDAGYQLSVGPERLDADVFHSHLREAQAARAEGRLADASGLLQRALGLWRGSALAGLSGASFDATRDRLAESRATALESWAALEMERGQHAQLLPRLAELVVEFPLREELRYLSMLALYRCGRQPEALAAFRDARQLLADEFGVEPSERLQELHRGILRAEPSLAAPEPPRPAVSGHRHQPSAARPPTAVLQPTVLPPVVLLPPAIPPPAAPRSRRFPVWLACTIAGAMPLLTCGLTSWLVVGVLAVVYRSRMLGVVAAAFLTLLVFFAVAMELDGPSEEAGPWASVGVLALFVATLGGSVAGALTPIRPPGRLPAPSTVVELAQRVRREQARQLVNHHPSIARELRIGRPDLPRTFDDGGLVDINNAPETILGSLHGIGPDEARRIVADRHMRGPLASVDELVTRNLVHWSVVRALGETLVAVRPG
ncbi:BTAD domain-containing putative transcriptional regulator [Dactylosporangium sp. NPDC000555]|uniref:BTAD domain-containing putative transcriptional regulator n=1 Tax=Dactylosporangium sp. NPDC000555 TaxID=3154260 RepID=UPI00331B17DA